MLLVSVIVAGLPPVAEAVDLLLGQARAVEVAAVACQDGCDDDCGEGCQDAGCHGDLHHCGCCATTTGVAPPAAWSPSGLPGTRDRHGPVALRGPPDRAPPPPWQPPRA
ncbi:hypothetical protein L6R53_32100 [Myxococcota bacterium]|nr:hypothetical protein [Myxococcota bacterium]